MSKTPEIATKFTMQGIAQAARDFLKLRRDASESLKKVRSDSANTLKPLKDDVERLKKDFRTLGRNMKSALGFGMSGVGVGLKVLRTGALGASAAVGGIAAAWTATYAAAAMATKETAKYMTDLSRQSRALGMSTEDMSILGYAAEQEGVAANDLTSALSRISSNFTKIRQDILSANEEFERFRSIARDDAVLALARGDGGGVVAAGNRVAAERMKSFAGIEERINYLHQRLAQVDVIGGPQDNQSKLRRATAIHEIKKQIGELELARDGLMRSAGPTGEALFGLQKHGLDFDAATRGGVEGFLALGDAMQRVSDPAERLRYSILLFGDAAGPKLVSLLMSGRDGLKKFQQEAEEMGIVVSRESAAMADKYERARTRMSKSWQGLKMSVGEILMPELTAASEQMTSFIVRHRGTIVSMIKSTINSMKKLFSDVQKIFKGRTQNIKTGWLRTVIDQIQWAQQQVRIFQEDVSRLMAGGNARWPWLDKLGKTLIEAAKYAEDIIAIISGKNAVNFPWLNELRDRFKVMMRDFIEQVQYFGTRFADALNMVISILKSVKDALEPIANFFGWDITTALFFLGLLKVSGILAVLRSTIGLIGGALLRWAVPAAFLAGLGKVGAALGVIGVGMSVLGGKGIPAATPEAAPAKSGIRGTTGPKRVTRAAPGVGAIGETMAKSRLNRLAMRTAIRAAFARFGAFALIPEGAFLGTDLGEYAGRNLSHQTSFNNAVELNRKIGDAHHRERRVHRVHRPLTPTEAHEQNKKSYEDRGYMVFNDWGPKAKGEPPVTERIQVDLTVNGNTASGLYPDNSSTRDTLRAIQQINRGGAR